MKWKELKKYNSILDEFSRMSPHELLNISSSASVSEIKNAYRRLVKKYHPDRADPFLKITNEEILKMINRAYKKLVTKP